MTLKHSFSRCGQFHSSNSSLGKLIATVGTVLGWLIDYFAPGMVQSIVISMSVCLSVP